MQIGIDIRPLRDIMTGIGRYLLKMLEALAERDRKNNYILFYNSLKGGIPGAFLSMTISGSPLSDGQISS